MLSPPSSARIVSASGNSEDLSATTPSSQARNCSPFSGSSTVSLIRQLAARKFEHEPFETVGRDADEGRSVFAFAIGQIVRHAPEDVVHFLVEVALGLEDRAPDQCIEAASDDRRANLEIER